MTNLEKKISEDLYLRRLSYNEFLKKYPTEINEAYLLEEFKSLFQSQDAEALKFLITIASYFGFTKEIGEALSQLIALNWHKEHEDIARILQMSIKVPNAVDNLVIAIEKKFGYLFEQDDYQPFVTICMYAIARINTRYSKEKLEQLSLSDDNIINEAAKFQLSRLVKINKN